MMLSRRRLLSYCVASAAMLVSLPALAGSYLDRASLLVHGANLELERLRGKVYDVEFARVAQKVADARVQAAGDMIVPEEVVQAHPHLLLFLENCERAASAALERKPKEFLKFLSLARDEEQLFRGILKQLG